MILDRDRQDHLDLQVSQVNIKLLFILCFNYYHILIHLSCLIISFLLPGYGRPGPKGDKGDPGDPGFSSSSGTIRTRLVFCLYVAVAYFITLLLIIQVHFTRGHLDHQDLLDQKALQVTRCSEELISRSFWHHISCFTNVSAIVLGSPGPRGYPGTCLSPVAASSL